MVYPSIHPSTPGPATVRRVNHPGIHLPRVPTLTVIMTFATLMGVGGVPNTVHFLLGAGSATRWIWGPKQWPRVLNQSLEAQMPSAAQVAST